MIILVCGGRYYNNGAYLNTYLNDLNDRYSILGLVHGAASGADRLAQEWQDARIALERRISKHGKLWCAGYPAQWDLYGRAAGPVRNQHMLDANPGIGLGVAFPGGRGTANMVSLMQAKRIPVLIAGGGEMVTPEAATFL